MNIKARCWDDANKEYLSDDDLNFVIHPYEGTVYRAGSYPDISGEWTWDANEEPDETLIPELFIGQNDKENNEIYDGDILQNGNGNIGYVLWHNAGFEIKWNDAEEPYAYGHFTYESCKIIGNIRENPDMIEF